MKGNMFWDLTPCILVEIYKCLGQNCCLSLQPWRWKQQVPT